MKFNITIYIFFIQIIKNTIYIERKISIEKDSALKFLETELFNTSCEKFHNINTLISLEILNSENFWIVDLTESGDIPENEYFNKCILVDKRKIFEIIRSNEKINFFKSEKFIIDYGKYCKYENMDLEQLDFKLSIKMNFSESEDMYFFFSFLKRCFINYC